MLDNVRFRVCNQAWLSQRDVVYNIKCTHVCNLETVADDIRPR